MLGASSDPSRRASFQRYRGDRFRYGGLGRLEAANREYRGPGHLDDEVPVLSWGGEPSEHVAPGRFFNWTLPSSFRPLHYGPQALLLRLRCHAHHIRSLAFGPGRQLDEAVFSGAPFRDAADWLGRVGSNHPVQPPVWNWGRIPSPVPSGGSCFGKGEGSSPRTFHTPAVANRRGSWRFRPEWRNWTQNGMAGPAACARGDALFKDASVVTPTRSGPSDNRCYHRAPK